jgi:carbon-monoxide dehydrogenase small subunit
VITLPLQLIVNGQLHNLEIEPHLTLLEVLRSNLGFSGSKEGCSTGHCGACTVLINGQPISSCLMLAAEVAGQKVLTVEGLAAGGKLHPVQSAFVSNGGLQCGFCTAGMMMSTVALLNRNPQPTEKEIRHSLAGNLCRCTGYQKIVEAVQSAAEVMHDE